MSNSLTILELIKENSCQVTFVDLRLIKSWLLLLDRSGFIVKSVLSFSVKFFDGNLSSIDLKHILKATELLK